DAEQHQSQPADFGEPVDLALFRLFGGVRVLLRLVGHCRSIGLGAHKGRASITTKACAQGWSSVRVRWISASWPYGVSSASRLAAPLARLSVGAPEGRFTTPMSFI